MRLSWETEMSARDRVTEVETKHQKIQRRRKLGIIKRKSTGKTRTHSGQRLKLHVRMMKWLTKKASLRSHQVFLLSLCPARMYMEMDG